MGATNTKTSLDTMFKRSVADKVNKLMPTTAILQKLYPSLEQRAKLGREYLVPVALTFEHGVTYGDDTAFALNAAVAGVYSEAKVGSSPVILRSQISQSAANRLANDEKAFLNWAGLRAEVMKSSLAKRAELSMLYGQSGLGTVNAVPVGSVVQITVGTFAPAIWGGMEGAEIEIYNGATLVGTGTILSIQPDAAVPTLTLTGATGMASVAAGHTVWLKGSKTNDMLGIDAICQTSGSLFGIDNSIYQLWKTNSYAVGGAITFGHVLKAAAKPVAKGGAEGEAILLVAPDKYEQLNSDYAAYRSTDSSYKSGRGVNGVESLEFHYQAGMISIMPHAFTKPSEAFLFNKDAFERIGASDLTFDTNVGGEGEFFLPMNGNAGYELRCQYDFSIFCNAPAKVVKLTGIS